MSHAPLAAVIEIGYGSQCWNDDVTPRGKRPHRALVVLARTSRGAREPLPLGRGQRLRRAPGPAASRTPAASCAWPGRAGATRCARRNSGGSRSSSGDLQDGFAGGFGLRLSGRGRGCAVRRVTSLPTGGRIQPIHAIGRRLLGWTTCPPCPPCPPCRRRRPDLLLELDLTQAPVSGGSDDPITRLRTRGRPQLRPILRALHEAAEDDRVQGLIAKVGGELPWAVMQELRLGVRDFAAHGKPTLAWAESFGEGSAIHDGLRPGQRVRRDLAAARRGAGDAGRRRRDDLRPRRAGPTGHRAADRAAPRVQERREQHHAHGVHRGPPHRTRPAGRVGLHRRDRHDRRGPWDAVETRATAGRHRAPHRPRGPRRSGWSTPWATATRPTPRCGRAWGRTPSCCSPIGGRRRAVRMSPRDARGTSPSSR